MAGIKTIELKDNELIFRFPNVHENAELRIEFQRTLRIPDDNREYPLPPGFGALPPQSSWTTMWSIYRMFGVNMGGVFLPMYQSEAMWIYF